MKLFELPILDKKEKKPAVKPPDFSTGKTHEEPFMSRRQFLKAGGILGLAALGHGVSEGLGKIEKIGECLEDSRIIKQKTEEIKNDVPPEVVEDDAEIDGEDIQALGEFIRFDSDKEIVLSGINLQEKLKNYWKKRYQEDFRLRESLVKAYFEMSIWEVRLKKIFKEAGVPDDFCYLSIPESHWNLEAKSAMEAAGPFQLMAETAKRHNLKVCGEVDERTDPLLSGRACAKELKELYDKTGDWDLALSGYNGRAFLGYISREHKKERNAAGKLLHYEGFLQYIGKKIMEKRKEIRAMEYAKHEVVNGDTVSKIAKKFKKSEQEIVDFNGIRDNKIKIGEVVRIPLSEDEKEKYFQTAIKKAGYLENLNYPAKFKAVMELIKSGYVAKQYQKDKYKLRLASI